MPGWVSSGQCRVVRYAGMSLSGFSMPAGHNMVASRFNVAATTPCPLPPADDNEHLADLNAGSTGLQAHTRLSALW